MGIDGGVGVIVSACVCVILVCLLVPVFDLMTFKEFGISLSLD